MERLTKRGEKRKTMLDKFRGFVGRRFIKIVRWVEEKRYGKGFRRIEKIFEKTRGGEK